MGTSARKQARKARVKQNARAGSLILIVLLIILIWMARPLVRSLWQEGEDPQAIRAYSEAAAEECMSFLNAPGNPRFENPDDFQVDSPVKHYYVDSKTLLGDEISTTTKPITFFIIKEAPRRFRPNDKQRQPYYTVDVITWPDMTYLAHKEIFDDNPTYKKPSHRSRTGYKMVYGEKTTLEKWLRARWHHSPRLPWESKW